MSNEEIYSDDTPQATVPALTASQHLLDIIRRCEVSRDQRKAKYEYLRLWYQRGTDSNGAPSRNNKIKPRVRLLNSFLYAPDSTRFSCLVPTQDQDTWAAHTDTARDVFDRRWRDSGADVQFERFVEWANVYGTTVAKLVPGTYGDTELAYVDPAAFGVLREDVPSIDKQKAFCHWFCLSLPELYDVVKGLSNAEDILAYAKSQSVPGSSGNQSVSSLPSSMQQIIITQYPITDTITGVLDLGAIGDDRAQVEEPLVELTEVWEQCEYKYTYPEGTSREGETCTFQDWKVSTVVGNWTILERRNPVLPWTPDGFDAEQPFVSVVPEPYPDYFWGASLVADLTQLQAWQEARNMDIDQLIKLNLKPPMFVSGAPLSDEKIKAIRSPGGFAATPMPGAKLETIDIQFPQQALDELNRIDAMFDEISGIPEILQASQGSQLRAGGQVAALANIAVGQIRAKALVIEDSLEVIATRMFHIMQRNDATPYPVGDGSGETFLLAQMPAGTKIQVDAHSASPVYADDLVNKAQLLKAAGAIDLPTFVEMINPPRVAALRQKAKKIEQNMAESAKAQLEIEQAKANRPARR